MKCPKCPGSMRTYDRNGVHIEQCESCRGIFLDYGELESLARLEGQVYQAPPPAQAPYPAQQPGWGQPHYGHHGHRKGGFARMLFSS